MALRDRLADAIRGKPTAVKSNAAMAAILSLGPYQAKWMNADFATFVREGFQGNPYVYASIRQISMAVAGIPWRAYTKPDKKKELDDHPILDLLHRPNPLQSGGRFFENFVGYLLLDGNVYVARAGGAASSSNGTGIPDELYILRPDRVRIVQGSVAQPVAGYVYKAGGYEVPYPVEMIRHTKLFNPTDDWYGLSPMQAAAKSIDQSNQSKAWNLSLLQNGARPAGAFLTTQTLEDTQYQRIKEMIEEQHAGYLNAGRIAIMEGGAKWAQMSMTPDDMSWLEGQKISAREIAMVFNIAPELIGDPESKTYSNFGEARRALYEENVLPLMDTVRDDFNSWICEPNSCYIDYDRDEIEALQEDRTAVYTRNNSSFLAGWVTINDCREAASMDRDPEAGDYYRWQLPQFAQLDPTADQPESKGPMPGVNVTGAPLPYPMLPPTHPLNAGPPQLLPQPGGAPGTPAAGAAPAKEPAAPPTAAQAAAAAKTLADWQPLPFPSRAVSLNGHATKKRGGE